MDPRFSSSVQTSFRTAGMDPLAPRGWAGRSPSDLIAVAPGAPPTYLIPTTQTGPQVPRMHPLAFPPTQSVLTDIPIPPRHMLAHPSPYSSSSGAPFDVSQLGRVNQGVNQGDRVSVVWTGGPQTFDPNFIASTYPFLILQHLVPD
jgi:hypothetical protein